MKLIRAHINNYKSFRRSGEIVFAPGFNIFIGQNDAGKSALMEALSTKARYIPHRSLATAQTATTPSEVESVFEFTYSVTSSQLKEYFHRLSDVCLPIQKEGSSPQQIEEAQTAFAKCLETDNEFTSTWHSKQNDTHASPLRGSLSGLQRFNHIGQYGRFKNSAAPHQSHLSYTGTNVVSPYPPLLASWLANRIYTFRAERLSVSKCDSQGIVELEPNASNLADVLNIFQSNYTFLWNKYCEHVKAIFPHITEVKSIVRPGNEVEIVISTSSPNLSRVDLDVSLAESGTGIGQVLAILFVAVRHIDSQVILIDEPQSFLHPGALRKLLEILREYGQHQYIVTTHSPLAFALFETDKMFQVTRTGEGSVVKPIEEREELIDALSDVGARLSDVYGAESVLWVEGPTEERSFPEIIHALGKRKLQGTVVIGVLATGDLEGRDGARICEIYQRLTKSSALLPKPIAFVFDRENRSDENRVEMERRLGGLMHWLPLRMYENYLLQKDAIAHVLNEIRGPRENAIAATDVEKWLNDNGARDKYFDRGEATPYGDSNWTQRVHGAKILSDLFFDLTNETGAFDYEKVKHGLMLTRYLVSSPTEDLKELASKLVSLLD